MHLYRGVAGAEAVYDSKSYTCIRVILGQGSSHALGGMTHLILGGMGRGEGGVLGHGGSDVLGGRTHVILGWSWDRVVVMFWGGGAGHM